jgi:hypothetical protein
MSVPFLYLPAARHAFVLVVLASALSCGALPPVDPQPIMTAYRKETMRKMQTPSAEIYYPERRRAEALRIGSRIEACVGRLRALTKSGRPRRKLIVMLPESDVANAYVLPPFLGPGRMVLPTRFSGDVFNFLNSRR